MGGWTGHRKGTKNYKNEVLIHCVLDILPNSKYGWQALALAYQEAAQEDEVQNTDDLKKHWINNLCNGMQKPTGWQGGDKYDRIMRCIAIKKKILEKIHAELMRWHYRLGHLSFAKLKMLAKNGEIPCHLAKVPALKCAGCLFGAMMKLPWRGKESKSSHKVFVTTKPGECVSINHMISTHVGFFSQSKGKLTSKRYHAASIFVDHFSCLRFIHLMQDLSSKERIKAKEAFEQFTAEHGVAIKHYHCDNGCFADNAFQQACQQSHQQLTFCRVNAHFQNGIAERAIRDLSESAQKQLLRTRQRWPAAVHTALWPYALRNVALLHNTLPMLEDGSSWLELFSSIQVGAKIAHNHTFACSVFALQNELAAGNTIPKWSPRQGLFRT
jgi:hypothetical protein